MTEEEMFQTGLHDLATGLCMQENGAADPWPPEVVADVRRYLLKRLDEWRPSAPRQEERDGAMKLYVCYALVEHERQAIRS